MSRWSEKRAKTLERAAQLVKAKTPSDVPDRERGEARVIEATSAWYHEKGVCGLAVGFKYEGGVMTDEPCVQVFVERKDAALPKKSPRRIRDFTLGGERIRTDVIECRDTIMDVGVAERIGRLRNPGSIGAFLRDARGRLYALSAGHVLCETFGDQTADGQREVIRRGDPLSAFDDLGGETGEMIAQLFDRRLFDFSNVYTLQNIDAAVAMLLPDAAATVDPADVPYARAAPTRVGETVRVIGATTRGAAAPGPVGSVSYSVRHDRWRFAGPDGVRQPIHFDGLYLARYVSAGGDSGGAVVRGDALVGMHIGREVTDSGEMGVFIDIGRLLGSWPFLRLLTSDNG